MSTVQLPPVAMCNIQKSVKSVVSCQTMSERCMGFTVSHCAALLVSSSIPSLHLTLDIHRHPTFKVWALEENWNSNPTEALLGKMAKRGKWTHLFLQKYFTTAMLQFDGSDIETLRIPHCERSQVTHLQIAAQLVQTFAFSLCPCLNDFGPFLKTYQPSN